MAAFGPARSPAAGAPGARGIAAPFLIALALMLAVAVSSLETLAAVRAYVEGESLYSKGQKDAVFYLTRYVDSRAGADLANYQRAVAKPLGDREARLALSAEPVDLGRARAGFLAGGNSPDDIGALIWFYRLFHRAPPLRHAIELWTEADEATQQIVAIAGRLEAGPGVPNEAELREARAQLFVLNARIAPLEDEFSATLGQAARQVTNWLLLATLTLGAAIALLGVSATRLRLRERQRYDAALRASEVRYRSLFESSNDAVLIAQASGAILDANPAACRLFGLEIDELRGRDLNSLALGEDRWFAAATTQAPALLRRDVVFERRGGSYAGEVSCTRFVDSDGETRFSVAIHDVTERRRLETEQRALAEQLQHARQMEAIGHLAGGIAHDFNNILSAVLGYAGLLEREVGDNGKARGWVQRIADSGRRARDLVQQILAFARKGGVERAPADVVPIIGETGELLRASLPSTVEFSVSLPVAPLVVRVNPAQLSQVVVNLCLNARDALHDRAGRIALGLAELTAGDPELAAFAQAAADGSQVTVGALDPKRRYARISVSDSGAGMTADVLQRIFTPFYTTKRRGQGTGLGLAVVHGIVMDSAGGCRVTSRPGEGSAFAVYLPALDGPPPAPTAAAPRAALTAQGHVLVIDDEPFVAEVVQIGLEQLGYRVTTLTDPVAAVARVEENPQEFDAVITDQVMPRLSGLDVLQRIHRVRPGLPVIVCTGFSNAATDEAVRAAGAAGFFHKPVPTEQLGDCLERTVRAGGSVRDR